MTEYRLVTVWHFEAPLAAVYAAVCDPVRWPEWWPDAKLVEQGRAGQADGVGQLLHCTWQGRLPYRLQFDLVTTSIQPLVAVEGAVTGDLEGSGRCLFSQDGAVTTVRHEWRVRTTRRWMNLLAPCARLLFKYNHALAMKRGGEELARRLEARQLGLEHADLGAEYRQGADDRLAAVGAGLAAGVLATGVQIALWWLAALPVAEMLWRDTRLTAAIVLGPAVLTSPHHPAWLVWLLAAAIHFLLSIAYGLLLARLVAGLAAAQALAAGGLFGLALYAVNLYGFTAIFPWFAQARDWIAAVTHLAFGVILAGSYLALRSCLPRRETP